MNTLYHWYGLIAFWGLVVLIGGLTIRAIIRSPERAEPDTLTEQDRELKLDLECGKIVWKRHRGEVVELRCILPESHVGRRPHEAELDDTVVYF